ncbi:hypothetical protein ACFYVL_01215 [Streptomyces sp. NPDC004111]|uniref:hypothetical protein n=1 Tax=Streptomyces sp. NPDC004111 TaxID=3364690 RepID=UPI003694C245
MRTPPDRLPFPIPTSTLNSPTRDASWHQHATCSTNKGAVSLDAAFSSLSVIAAAEGADEVVGVTALWGDGTGAWRGWFAYGTAIWYQENG